MSNTFRRGNTLWIFYSVDGKQYRRSTGLKYTKSNKKIVLARCAQLDELLENNQIIPEDLLRFEKFDRELLHSIFIDLTNEFNRFIETKNEKHKMMFKLALKKFQLCNELIPDMPMLKLNAVDKSHYQKFKDYLLNNHAYETARSYINYLSIFFNDCIKRGIYKKENPFIRLKRMDKKEITIVQENHLKLILEYLKEQNIELYRFVFFLRYSGFRLAEALALTWGDINFENNSIQLKNFKANRYEVFPISLYNGLLKNFLYSYHRKSGKVFNLKYDWIRVPFQNAIKQINKKRLEENSEFDEIPMYTLHDFRKTFITDLAQSNLSIFEVKNLARHRDIATTERYYINIKSQNSAQKFNAYLNAS